MKNIAIVCGGFTGEDVVSLKSAETFLKHIDRTKNRVFKVVVSKEGWSASDDEGEDWKLDRSDFSLSKGDDVVAIDGVINTIHGTPGEDGKIQGYFDLLDIPYNCSDVMVSSLTFNKGFCNQYLKQQGIHVADSVFLRKGEAIDEDRIIQDLGLPCFVKPNDAGSSLGVSKVTDKAQLRPAIQEAFEVSDRVLIERFISGTEITCGVITKEGKVTALAVTEIDFKSDFFDFDAKYNSPDTNEITPARISEEDYNKTMEVSSKIYSLLGAKGFFRADYILMDGILYLIEVNTTPGMSSASLMPQQLEYAQIELKEIIQEQIDSMV